MTIVLIIVALLLVASAIWGLAWPPPVSWRGACYHSRRWSRPPHVPRWVICGPAV